MHAQWNQYLKTYLEDMGTANFDCIRIYLAIQNNSVATIFNRTHVCIIFNRPDVLFWAATLTVQENTLE